MLSLEYVWSFQSRVRDDQVQPHQCHPSELNERTSVDCYLQGNYINGTSTTYTHHATMQWCQVIKQEVQCNSKQQAIQIEELHQNFLLTWL